MQEDTELLRRYAAEKSEDAFAELVRRHLNLVYSVALRQVGGDVHLAEDVTQQVFTALARKAAMLVERPALSGWLFRSAHFAASDVVRVERRRRAREQKVHAMNTLVADTSPPTDWVKVRPVLDKAIAELDERDRDAVALRFFDGCSFADLGAKLQLTENAARMRVDRALDKLHALLARRGVTSSAAALGAALANQTGVAAPAGLAAAVTGMALAGATGGGAALTMTLMSVNKIAAVLSGLAVLGAIGIGFREATITRRVSEELAVVRNERDNLRLRLASIAAGPAKGTATNVSRKSVDGTTAQELAVSTASPFTGGQLEYVLDHPETRGAFLQQAALSAKVRFDRFFRTAGLTDEQQDGFLEVAMDDAESRLEAFAVRRAAGGVGPNASKMDPAAIAQITEIQNRNDVATRDTLQELLGDKFKLGMEYLKTVSERNVADQLASRLYYTDSPLTGQQAEQLTQILEQNPYGAQPPSNSMGGIVIPPQIYNGAVAQAMNQNLPWMWDTPVTDAAIARAAVALSPSQLAALKLLQAQQLAQLQFAPPARSKDRRIGEGR